MDAKRRIDALAGFPQCLRAAVAIVPADDVRWKPADGAAGGTGGAGGWSVLEIVCHLADEEVEDFRTRLRLTLEDPRADWPSIDPEGWARQRRYNEKDLAAELDRFEGERQESLRWLRSLQNPDWSTTHTHPKFGSMQAGDLLIAWSAHDALHLRQIAKRLYQLARRDGSPYKADYAGTWSA